LILKSYEGGTFKMGHLYIHIRGVLKRYVKNLRRYSSHLKDEKHYMDIGAEMLISGVMLKILLAVLLTQGKI